MGMNNSALLTRLEFIPESRRLAIGARVYLLVGILHRKSNEEVLSILSDVFHLSLSDYSQVVIVDSILPHSGDVPLATRIMWQCRDMTMRQLHNSGDRTLGELKKLLKKQVMDDLFSRVTRVDRAVPCQQSSLARRIRGSNTRDKW